MRSFSVSLHGIVLAAAAVGCSRAAASSGPDARAGDPGAMGFAVVELFTSEGCSSCPPADEVFRDWVVEASRSGRRVYPLAFHVDYWNGLGWPDPYSSAAATTRQEIYARALGQQGVYTPELIVNGRDAFVGSNRARARRSIEGAIGGRGGTAIDLRAKAQGSRISVDFSFDGAPPAGTMLQLALVQSAATTEVRAGENVGRTLHHANVVRGFQTIPAGGIPRGHSTFAATPEVLASGAVIAFLQDPDTMAVRGAARAALDVASERY